MAQIKSVSVSIARVPLNQTTFIARRKITARDYCLVRVTADSGLEGVGFCYVGHAGGAIARVVIEDLLGPRLIGEESLRVQGIWEDLYQEALLHGRAGTVMRAISAIDIALWDLNAQAAGLPLHKYLGSGVVDRVPAYASGGYYVPGKTPEMLGEEVRDYVRRGFTAVKIKVGRLSLQEEEARVRAARDAVGPDVALMLDANNAWRDLPTALSYVKRFEPYNPYWIEEPFSPDDIDNHARLAEKTSVLVATGEIEVGRWRFKELLEKVPGVILQTDAAVCGGISEWMRIANMAAGHGAVMCPHWFHDLHAHLVAATTNSRFVEFFPGSDVLNFRDLIDCQLEFADGKLILSESPGIGFKFDEKSIRKYALEGWSEIRA